MKTKCNTILVSGGAGFVGSHLCSRLLQDGYSVLCLDNLYTGSLENISAFKGTHEELIKQKGYYYTLVNNQLELNEKAV